MSGPGIRVRILKNVDPPQLGL